MYLYVFVFVFVFVGIWASARGVLPKVHTSTGHLPRPQRLGQKYKVGSSQNQKPFSIFYLDQILIALFRVQTVVGQLEGEQKVVEQMQACIHKLLTFMTFMTSLVQKKIVSIPRNPPNPKKDVFTRLTICLTIPLLTGLAKRNGLSEVPNRQCGVCEP